MQLFPLYLPQLLRLFMTITTGNAVQISLHFREQKVNKHNNHYLEVRGLGAILEKKSWSGQILPASGRARTARLRRIAARGPETVVIAGRSMRCNKKPFLVWHTFVWSSCSSSWVPPMRGKLEPRKRSPILDKDPGRLPSSCVLQTCELSSARLTSVGT